jgi:hypothetical protein
MVTSCQVAYYTTKPNTQPAHRNHYDNKLEYNVSIPPSTMPPSHDQVLRRVRETGQEGPPVEEGPAPSRMPTVRTVIPLPAAPTLLSAYALEEGEVLPPKPIPNTQAAINHTDLATGLVAAATWSSSGLPLPKKSRPTRHRHITERHKIIFASVGLYAHGASLLGRSDKIITPVDRSSYLGRAAYMLLRLQTSTRRSLDVTHEDIST